MICLRCRKIASREAIFSSDQGDHRWIYCDDCQHHVHLILAFLIMESRIWDLYL